MNVKERRKYPRIRVGWAVSILAADGSKQGKMEDISLEGGFISCDRPPRPNEKVLLNYSHYSNKIQVIAQVVWKNREFGRPRDKKAGMGVKFLQFLNNQSSTER